MISPTIDKNLIVAGRGVAIDRDTLVLYGLNIRLNGIAAPELNAKGRQSATFAIGKLLKDKAIRGLLSGQKSYKRHIDTY